MKDLIFPILFVLFFCASIAFGIYIAISNWNECREVFSFLYCLTHGK